MPRDQGRIREGRFAPNQTDRIDVEHERRFATPIARFRIEHPDLAEGLFDFVQTFGMLVQKISRIGRRLMCGRDRQKHDAR